MVKGINKTRVTIIIMVLTIVSKFFGFARELVLSYVYGTSNISDAYILSITIPMIIFGFVGMGLMSSFVPIYYRALKDKGDSGADSFSSNYIYFTLLIFTIAVFLINIGETKIKIQIHLTRA